MLLTQFVTKSPQTLRSYESITKYYAIKLQFLIANIRIVYGINRYNMTILLVNRADYVYLSTTIIAYLIIIKI